MTPYGRGGSALYVSTEGCHCLNYGNRHWEPHPRLGTGSMFAGRAITGTRFPSEPGTSSRGAGLAPSTPLSCMQICHLISLLHLCAKPVSIPLQTWRCNSPPTPGVSRLFSLYCSTIWFVICSHCLWNPYFKTHRKHSSRILEVCFPSIWIIIVQIRKTEWTYLRRKELGTEPSWFLWMC